MSRPAPPSRFRLYWHTLRHLKPVQIFGRLWFRLYRPRPNLEPAPPLRVLPEAWHPAITREPSLLGADTFHFLSVTGRLGELGWDSPRADKLWRYNLHYFDDLDAVAAEQRSVWHQALLADWLQANPPGQGTGWESYPLSLRIVNWIKYALRGFELPPDCVQSLAVQARWLDTRLEWHLLGNHLLSNAKALVFAGCFFTGREAEHWLSRGLAILDKQLPEQILADGGHFERSTMYHALVLEDLLDLINVLRSAGLEQHCASLELEMRATAMLAWLQHMRHPDGEIAFFNDAAFGIAAAPPDLVAYAEALGSYSRTANSPVHLADSGYIRLSHDSAVLLLDTAPLGPDYLPGHAHADTLSFELSLFNHRVLVNSGTSCYGNSPERLRQRGTAAHNCLVVADTDSSEVWHGFRVARRARPQDVQVDLADLRAACSHDGYLQRLSPGVMHRRTWHLGTSCLEVVDQLAPPAHPARAHYHLHPGIQLQDVETGKRVQLHLPGGQRAAFQVTEGTLHIETSTWHPRFGCSEPTHCLVVTAVNGKAGIRLDWH